MASKMLHTCLRVENLEKSIAFYADAFGFKELRRKDFPEYKFTIVYLGLEGDDYELELTYNYDHGPYVIGDGFAHVGYYLFISGHKDFIKIRKKVTK